MNVAGAIGTSIDTWEAETADEIFGERDTVSMVDGVDLDQPDNKNEIYFGTADPNVLAYTVVWGRFSGPPASRELVEFDMIFNDDAYAYGDATTDSSLADLQAIATHELGHALGLDHPSGDCTEETMYAYYSLGETHQRSLHAGDIAGATELYGAAPSGAAAQATLGAAIDALEEPPVETPPVAAPPTQGKPEVIPPVTAPPFDTPPVDSTPEPLGEAPIETPPVAAPPTQGKPEVIPPLTASPFDAPPVDGSAVDIIMELLDIPL